MKGLGVVGVMVLLAVGGCDEPQPESKPNPEYASWAKHKPGTMVRHRFTQTIGGETQTVVIQTRLKAVAPDHVAIETRNTVTAGSGSMQTPATARRISSLLSEVPSPGIEISRSVESVTVEGGTYKCTKTVRKVTRGDVTVTSTVWISDEVPGGRVKMTSVMGTDPPGESQGELIDVDLVN